MPTVTTIITGRPYCNKTGSHCLCVKCQRKHGFCPECEICIEEHKKKINHLTPIIECDEYGAHS